MSNLGIALGAGVDEANTQRRMTMAEDEAARQKEQFGWAKQAQEQHQAVKAARAKVLSDADAVRKQYAADPYAAAQSLSSLHSQPGWDGDATSEVSKGLDGKVYVTRYNGKGVVDTGNVERYEVTPKFFQQALDDHVAYRMAEADPDNYLKNRADLKKVEQGAELIGVHKVKVANDLALGNRGLDVTQSEGEANRKQRGEISEAELRQRVAASAASNAIARAGLAFNERRATLADAQYASQQEALRYNRDRAIEAERLASANKLIADVGLDPKEIPAFIRYVNENHVGGERQADGSFMKTGDEFESLTPAQQQKMMPSLLGKYLQWKQDVAYGLGSKTSQEFTEKPASAYKPGENKLQWSDIDRRGDGWFEGIPKITSDDPTDMTVGKYLRAQLPGWLPGSLSDEVVVSTAGDRIRKADHIGNRYDANGFLVKGRKDERKTLRDATGAK